MTPKQKPKTKKKEVPVRCPDTVGVPYTLEIEDCITCGLRFGIPQSFYNEAVKQFGELFYCPRGHAAYNVKGRARRDKRREEDEHKKRLEKLRKDKAEKALKEKEREANKGFFGRLFAYKLW